MLSRIIYRIQQFLFSMSARMHDRDTAFARQYLDIKESALFFSLPPFEQKHAVVVAEKMAGFAKGMKSVDQRKLIRLGLLHDIGKAAVRLSIFDKTILVVLHRAIPPLYNFLAQKGEPENASRSFRKYYVHKHHGMIGAKMLERIGENQDIIREVADHDTRKIKGDVYMDLLDRADSTY
ncbi:HDIG domain-containing protein [Candidatus Saganbacteria bacterium]|nr:HDIG domain-containing protein [Candidatus Saganbacteria bacterium]